MMLISKRMLPRVVLIVAVVLAGGLLLYAFLKKKLAMERKKAQYEQGILRVGNKAITK